MYKMDCRDNWNTLWMWILEMQVSPSRMTYNACQGPCMHRAGGDGGAGRAFALPLLVVHTGNDVL